MLSYSMLDTIADAYVPALALFSLLWVSKSVFIQEWKSAVGQVCLLSYVLVVAYGWMLIDNRFGIWPSYGHDYSTHTAVALGLACFLLCMPKPQWQLILFSLASYGLLMFYQQYHTVADMVSTSVVVILFLLPGAWAYFKFFSQHVLNQFDSRQV